MKQKLYTKCNMCFTLVKLNSRAVQVSSWDACLEIQHVWTPVTAKVFLSEQDRSNKAKDRSSGQQYLIFEMNICRHVSICDPLEHEKALISIHFWLRLDACFGICKSFVGRFIDWFKSNWLASFLRVSIN